MGTNATFSSHYLCSDRGLLLPLVYEGQWAAGTRAVLYFVGLLYSFVGVAVIADVFMCAIERITSTTHKVRVGAVDGAATGATSDHATSNRPAVQYREVLIWNPTVANLTLMALGSSAPEILLSIIEIVGNGFKAGDLGPGTIVGSAAYNLMAIVAVCILSVRTGDKKRIDQFAVFCTTAAWSIFAYIWLIIVLRGFSPNVVEIWEGLLTLLFFGGTVLSAYLVSVKTKRWGKTPADADVMVLTDAHLMAPLRDKAERTRNSDLQIEELSYDSSKLHKLFQEYMSNYPTVSHKEIAEMVAYKLQNEMAHDRLWYRIMAIRGLTSSLPKKRGVVAAEEAKTATGMTLLAAGPKQVAIEFDTIAYGINPNLDKRAYLKIVKRGSSKKQAIFRYKTVSGSAEKNVHFLDKAETVIMEPNEYVKYISIQLLNPNKWKQKMAFWVKLETDNSRPSTTANNSNSKKLVIGRCGASKVIFPLTEPPEIVIEFARRHVSVQENKDFVRIPLLRKGTPIGAKVPIQHSVDWSTKDITAVSGQDYVGDRGNVQFEEGALEKYIDVQIINDFEVEKDETFLVKLSDANQGAKVGTNDEVTVSIINDDQLNRKYSEFEYRVNRMLRSLKPFTTTWKEQMLRAISVNQGDVADASLADCAVHIIAFPWKVIAALTPPPQFFGGWLTFFVSLLLIGLLTAVVGDLAAIFGCLVHLKDSVTAITFVALGTSLPDTFASRLATIQEKTADNAIGNITGSNSVNVFLGLGLPWFIAACYWTSKRQSFVVSADDLGFTVTVYTILSLLCIGLMFLRRKLSIFGKAELGGPTLTKWLSAVFILFLWSVYVVLSSLQAYGHIPTF